MIIIRKGAAQAGKTSSTLSGREGGHPLTYHPRITKKEKSTFGMTVDTINFPEMEPPTIRVPGLILDSSKFTEH